MPKWRDFERSLARKHGGRVQPGSGSGPVNVGDVRTKHRLMEAKHTTKASFVLKLADLEKIERRAAREGRKPVFAISFSGKVFYVLPEYVYEGED